jgi:phage head maturation protease
MRFMEVVRDTVAGAEAYARMKAGILKALSVGFGCRRTDSASSQEFGSSRRPFLRKFPW